MEWVCAVTGTAAPTQNGPAEFQSFLKNGQVLCKLANTLKPGVCRQPHDTSKTKLAVSFTTITLVSVVTVYSGSSTKQRK